MRLMTMLLAGMLTTIPSASISNGPVNALSEKVTMSALALPLKESTDGIIVMPFNSIATSAMIYCPPWPLSLLDPRCH